MSSPFVAEIRMFATNFAPTGWALCNGQILPISQNTALFALLGTYYGGDGKSTFALPNLEGSVPIGQGQSSTGTMAPQMVTPSGGSLPHNNMQPYLTVNFCIAMQGVFPPRG